MLQTYTGYPTNVEVCIITNAPERLSNVLHSRWKFTSVSVCGTTRKMTHAFQLAWEHRDIMELVYEKGKATDRRLNPSIGIEQRMLTAFIVPAVHRHSASGLACTLEDHMGHMQNNQSCTGSGRKHHPIMI